MSFHPQKCKALSFSVAMKKYEPLLPFQIFFYNLNGTLLDYTDSEQDLGVIINSKFFTDDQCDKKYNIMNQKLGMLKRVCYFTKNPTQKGLFIWQLFEVS